MSKMNVDFRMFFMIGQHGYPEKKWKYILLCSIDYISIIYIGRYSSVPNTRVGPNNSVGGEILENK
jgi:hypothetical protein